MSDNPLQRLSELEKETLRHWRQRKTAKQIAREISVATGNEITHFAIHERLREARRKLGVSTSAEAAELLARAEQNAGYKPFVDDVPALAEATVDHEPSLLSDTPSDASAPRAVDAVAEVRAEFDMTQPPPSRLRQTWLSEWLERGNNNLTVAERLRWMILFAFGMVVVTFLLLAAAESLQTSLQRHFHPSR